VWRGDRKIRSSTALFTFAAIELPFRLASRIMRMGIAVLTREIILFECRDKNDASVALRFEPVLFFLFSSTVFIKENVTP
jgi:hypothetical protein